MAPVSEMPQQAAEAQMTQLENMFGTFESVSLEAMESVKLLDRLDSKFTLRFDQLAGVLDALVPHYRLLDVNGIRAHRYETLYFDTDDLTLYIRHHDGKFPRHKVRDRRYADSGRCFFEIKSKTNKGRTIKTRLEREHITGVIDAEAGCLLRETVPCSPTELRPVLWVNFTRLTFAGAFSPERVTIDLDLSYRDAGTVVRCPQLAIAEVKRARSMSGSPFIRAMRDLRIREESMSKYCFGIVKLRPGVKANLFKERVRRIEELTV